MKTRYGAVLGIILSAAAVICGTVMELSWFPRLALTTIGIGGLITSIAFLVEAIRKKKDQRERQP